jgi:glutamate synthase (NADPH/NADH) small chain
MDAARVAKRLGAGEVYISIPPFEKEMPARAEEIHHAKEEGIEFHLLTNPIEILGDEKGNVTGMTCVAWSWEAGIVRPPQAVVIDGSEYTLDVDAAIISIGQSPNPLIKNSTPELKHSPGAE